MFWQGAERSLLIILILSLLICEMGNPTLLQGLEDHVLCCSRRDTLGKKGLVSVQRQLLCSKATQASGHLRAVLGVPVIVSTSPKILVE